MSSSSSSSSSSISSSSSSSSSFSETCVQCLKTAYECFAKGDIPGILDQLADDIVLSPIVHHGAASNSNVLKWRRVFKGKKEVAEGFFPSLMSCIEVVGTGMVINGYAWDEQNKKVIAIYTLEMKGRASGKTGKIDGCHIWTFNKDGKPFDYHEILDEMSVIALLTP